MKSIKLHGENYILGKDKAISHGLNMQCDYCLADNLVLCEDEDGKFIKSDGINILVQDFDDCWLDTPENRKKLKQIIKEKNENR